MFVYFVVDFLFKFLVIGSAGAGKSCILHQFIENKCKYGSHRKIIIESWYSAII